MARDFHTVGEIRDHLERRHKAKVSRHTVARALKSGKHPLHWGVVQRTKVLRPENQKLRLRFCLDNLHPQFWSWVFLDAKDLYLYPGKHSMVRHCWQDIDDPPVQPASGNPIVFRFYGAVSLSHKSALYFVPPSPAEGTRAHKSTETFKSIHFIRVMRALKKELAVWYPNGQYAIIRDHAKQHTSIESTIGLARLGMKIKKDFPPQSFDMNVIENVWGMLSNILVRAHARSSQEWRQAIKEAWAQVQQSSIDALVKGVPARLERIKAAQGRWVPHH